MSDHLSSNPLGTLLQRLKEDGGRYLLSVALTAGEHAAQEPATFGGKSWKRWLTDQEYKELVALLECDQFAKPLSCETHGLVPDLALFDHKCPACERDKGWDAFYKLRKSVGEERYPGMTGVIRPADETTPALAPICQFCGNELREPGTTLCPLKETHTVVNK